MRFVLALFVSLIASTAHAVPSMTIDLESGRVLQSEQAFDPWHPASLTKMMTAYTTFRAIAEGRVAADAPVVISRTATRQPPSKMGYRVGTTLTVESALKILLIKSANDVAVALAEAVSGSEQGFVLQMNADAARLGMIGSRFTNPHGLHNAAQVVTARDMGVLARALHREFPTYKSYFSTPSVMAPKRAKSGKTIQRVYFSYNLLLERFAGADGFKTGFVCASGYNFVGSATRNGRRIAAIVLGRDGQKSRAVDAARLITEGFEKPLAFGTPIERLAPGAVVATQPRNMRPIICTEAARAARYDPGAGQAVIESPWLQKRQITRVPLVATLQPRATLGFQAITVPKFRRASAPFVPATVTPASAKPSEAVQEKPVVATETIAPVTPTKLKPTIDGLLAELSPSNPVQPSSSFIKGPIPLPKFRADPR